MTWDILNFIGTIAFALSGAIVAMEEDYDIVGVIVLGFTTAFGGGLIRNVLLEVPVSQLWEQDLLLKGAVLATIIIFLLPNRFIFYWRNRLQLFDAIGLAAFAIQGAMYATNMGYPLSATLAAAVLTGTGGGVVRDVLAKRKPTILKDDIYAGWALLVGLVIGLGLANTTVELLILFVVIVFLRLCTTYYRWKLPKRFIHLDS